MLNVGCGHDERGDVRIDICRGSSANLLADAQHLPFQDHVFDLTISISVLEHIENWSLALIEIFRVSRSQVVVEVPVNSDIRITDPWRILFPSRKNLQLFKTIPERARETLWQFDPVKLFLSCASIAPEWGCELKRHFQIYAGVPSRAWRLRAWRSE